MPLVRLVFCLIALAAPFCFPALTSAEQFSSAQLDDITEHLRSEGTYYNNNQPMPCGTFCSEARLAEHRPIPNQATSAQLHTELAQLRQKAKIVRPIKELGRILLRAAPAAGAVIGVYTIGDGINRRFFKIGYHQPEPLGDAATKFSQPAITWWSIPQSYDIGEGDPVVLPADSFHFSFSWGSSHNNYFWATFSQPWCTHGGFPVPEGMTIESGIDHCGFGDEYGTAYGAWSKTAPILDSGKAADLPPGETVDGHIYEQPDAPFAEDRGQVETELETNPDEYRIAIPWYQHLVHPEDYPDPRTTTEHDHRCDLEEPTYENPGGSTNPAPHALRVSPPFTTSERPSGAQGEPDPFLRYGEAAWIDRPPPATSYIDDWNGWGWRHIQAKHGWGPDDEAATRQTLFAPAETFEQNPTSMRYVGPEYAQNGAWCARWVVVEYGVKGGDPPNTPKGIITSHARFVRNID